MALNGRRMMKIEVTTNSVPEFELRDTGRYSAQEGGEGGNRKGRRDIETEGGGKI